MAETGKIPYAARIEKDIRLLELLSQTFGNVSSAATEIINLEAILNLPKGTEHFVADIHGEHEAFAHILKNASGNIKRKVADLFGTTMRKDEIRELCSLIYYPEKKLEYIHEEEASLDDFYSTTLHRLVKVLQTVSAKYTRSKVRKALPKEFAYIIEELLHEVPSEKKAGYYNRVIETIISTNQADSFIIAICNVIQRLSIDRLHILGDIYDRGQGAHIILDTLLNYKDYDIQWGNHDALWMGAAAGNDCCIANVLRISLRYDNMATLEDGYGINLVPLATFAMETYGDDPCPIFEPKVPSGDSSLSLKSRRIIAKMHKAISVIQWKLEAALIARHPEWNMEGRNLLHLIDMEKKVVLIDGKEYPMPDVNFPTIDPADPYRLSDEEAELVEKLVHSFKISDKLKKHIGVFFSHGCMYNVCNGNLLFHASIPMNEDGTLKEVEVMGRRYKGKELLHNVGMLMRSAFNNDTPADVRDYAVDYYFYIWCGPDSPLFDKSKMATFERYFLTDKAVRHEEKGHYYRLRLDPKICDLILDDFGVVGKHRHIINGHVPVKAGDGENPIKAEGKLMVIDGGFSKAYHNTTGIAGYTLVYHSRGLQLVQHEPFSSAEDAARNGTDIKSTTQVVELNADPVCVRDTDIGGELQGQIDELLELLYAYRHGIIKERK
jgi:fructose-1,6-bisphosphatase-3